MINNVLEDYWENVCNEFIRQNHIFLYIMRKNISIITFILTCKINKDFVYYKEHTLNYFIEQSLVDSDFFYILKYILKYSVNLTLSNQV